MSGRARYRAVGRNFAARDSANGGKDAFPHGVTVNAGVEPAVGEAATGNAQSRPIYIYAALRYDSSAFPSLS